jgi:IS4 transposase
MYGKKAQMMVGELSSLPTLYHCKFYIHIFMHIIKSLFHFLFFFITYLKNVHDLMIILLSTFCWCIECEDEIRKD